MPHPTALYPIQTTLHHTTPYSTTQHHTAPNRTTCQMRIVKQRLLEMMPALSIFLDVDDLEDISDLEGYVDRSVTILIFCSKGYFQSKNCIREIRSCTAKHKPMIAVLDPDSATGALTLDEVQAELLAADERYDAWGFTGDGGPVGQDCFETLFAGDPIEWNRIGAFQDVTLRLIAERMLPPQHGKVYLSGELVHDHVDLPSPSSRGKTFHLYVSPHNAGAMDFVDELSGWYEHNSKSHHLDSKKRRGFHGRQADKEKSNGGGLLAGMSRGVKQMRQGALEDKGPDPYALDPRAPKKEQGSGADVKVLVTQDTNLLGECEAMLCYLNSKTWTSGKTTEAFANDIAAAMRRGVAVTLVHEMPGVGGQGRADGIRTHLQDACNTASQVPPTYLTYLPRLPTSAPSL